MFKKANILYLIVFGLMVTTAGPVLIAMPKMGYAVAEWLFVFVPCLVFLAITGVKWRDAIPLRRVSAPVWLITIALSISLWAAGVFMSAVLAILATKIGLTPPELPLPIPENTLDWVLITFGISISAGITEEVMFRGVIFTAYRQMGAGPAVVFSSLLFALLHQSFYRFLPILGIGLLLGYMVSRTGSVLPGIFAHILNNALSLGFFVLVTRDDRFPFTGNVPMENMFAILLAVSVLALPVLLKLLKMATPAADSGRPFPELTLTNAAHPGAPGGPMTDHLAGQNADLSAVFPGGPPTDLPTGQMPWGLAWREFFGHWPVPVSMVLFIILGLLELVVMLFPQLTRLPG